MPTRTRLSEVSKTTTTTVTYLPTSIAGCQLWLDGADQTTITQSGGTVSQWNDKSGNGYNFTQATTAYQPTFVSGGTNGLSLLRFNGTSQYLGGGTTLNIGTNNIAIFAVCKYAADVTLGSSYIFAKSLYGGAAARILFGVQSMGIGDGTGGNIWWQGSSYESSYASYHSVEFVTTRASGVNTFYANGTQFYQISPGVDTSTNWTSGYNMIVGGYNNPSGGISPPQPDLYMKGDICEILIYASTITTTNRQTIESYLAQKWGLTASLPAGHPGLTTMIYGTVVTPIPTTTTTTFLPTSIAGCSLWLDGAASATITQSGGTVSQWSDKSGNARHITQSTTGNQPTYSSTSNAVVFTGSQYLNIPTALAATTPVYTIFVVERRASANVMFFIGQYNLTSANTALILGYNSATVSHHTTVYVSDCQVTVPTYAGASEPMRINRYDYTGTTRDTFINGGALSTTQSFSATLTTWSSANVGIGFGTTYGYIGNIYEIIFYNATLTTTQQQTIESYLAQKWGMTSSLATGHPGITTPVYTITVTLPKQKISSIPKVTFVNYLPTSITGCKVWFDAYDASYTTTGTTVTGWTNKTGNANASTGGGTVSINLATLGGKSSVRFSAGTNYLNVGSLSYSTAYRNQFFVVTVGASGSVYVYLNCNDGICGQCYSWSDGDIEINKSGTLGLRAYPTGFFSSTAIVSICTSSGANTGIWVNGANKTLTDNNTGTGGFWSTGSGAPTLGGISGITAGTTDMYELLQYDGILTTTQRQTIESYLAQKWGLTANLVAGHPGLTTTVYGTTTATVKQKISAIPATVVAPSIPFSITSGLLAFFSFDNTLADSKNTITLAATGSVSYAAGRTTNQAIYLANEANISAGTYPSNYLRSTYNLPSVFTVSLWFKPTNTSRGNLFTSYNGFSPSNSPNNVLNIYIIGGAVYIAYSHIANNGAGYSITVGTWYNATITVNNGSFTLYMNGSQSGSTLSSTPYISGFSIGDYPESSSDFYTYAGYLDDYRIYNRVLTGTEISAIYAGTG